MEPNFDFYWYTELYLMCAVETFFLTDVSLF